MKKGFLYAIEVVFTCCVLYFLLVAVSLGAELLTLLQGDYPLNTIDTARSQDGAYSVTLQEIEDPTALRLYGPAFCHLVLTRGGAALSEMDIAVFAGDGNVTPRSWQVSWASDHAEIILFGNGSEQQDEMIEMYFHGLILKRRLSTAYGKPISASGTKAAGAFPLQPRRFVV